MASVWIVTSGEYSDYGIEAVFTTEAAANATRDLMNGPDGEDSYGAWKVEEWPLDEEPHRKAWACLAIVRVGRQVPDGVDLNRRWIVDTLDTPEVEIQGPTLNDDESTAPDRVTSEEGWVRSTRDDPPYQWSVWVTATDPERAKKAAAERAYQVAAQWEIEVEAARSRGALD